MLKAHMAAFFSVAKDKHVWIGLREPNPLSERHIGQSIGTFLCHPKPANCGAKTVKVAHHPLCGLVADPYHPKCGAAAFGGNLIAAKMDWVQFRQTDAFSKHFRVVDSGAHAGALMMLASNPSNSAKSLCFLHSDYDLMAIVPADSNGRMISTGVSPLSSPRKGEFYTQTAAGMNLEAQSQSVIDLLNQRIGWLPMVQHGPEFEYGTKENQKRVGAAPKEQVWWFGPKENYVIIGESSMSTATNEKRSRYLH